MSKEKYGVGVIGTGWVAGAHIDNFSAIEGCEVVAVSSRSKEKAAAKISNHNLENATPYDNLQEFLKHPGLDIVVICTPHPNHPDETIAAAEAGKHIVIEKPVALNRQDLHRMYEAVEKAGVTTSVCFEVRWIGSIINAKKFIEQGLIGDPFFGSCSYFHGIGPWYGQWGWNIKKDMGGDALLTAGCHALDALIWLMGSPVKEVAAFGQTSKGNPLKYEYDPNIVSILRFENGAIGNVSTSIECRQPYEFPVLIQGTRGSIKDNQLSSLEFESDSWIDFPTSVPDSGDVADHSYPGQLRHFVDCLRNGTRPINDLKATMHVHEVMFAMAESRETGEVVQVPR
ncbi:MAG: Gfo/Idh/MocA family oxidoreductase [Saprospiraceae bacterium]|nr:Gfo/Idh/MocA family oxidoreductase [Saprospiraceae bacterium]